jgi:hypothetical protein
MVEMMPGLRTALRELLFELRAFSAAPRPLPVLNAISHRYSKSCADVKLS